MKKFTKIARHLTLVTCLGMLLNDAAVAQTATKPADANAICAAVARTRGLAGAVTAVMHGDAQGFARLREASAQVGALSQFGSAGTSERFALFQPLAARIVASSQGVLGQQADWLEIFRAAGSINRATDGLLRAIESLTQAQLKSGAGASAGAAAAAASAQLGLFAVRLAKSAAEFTDPRGASPEGVFLLGQDANSFRSLSGGLRLGGTALQLKAATSAEVITALDAVDQEFGLINQAVISILGRLGGYVPTQPALAQLLIDAALLDRNAIEACTGVDKNSTPR